jgi:HD superfamily phosphohydrolase YqeK
VPSTRSSESADPVDRLHPLIIAAARDDALPDWAACRPERMEHCRRVADLMVEWADALGLSEADHLRWRAAAILHDALRDADPSALRVPNLDHWPPGMRHGPACARRLREDGVEDTELLDAISCHTVGSPRSTPLSDYLYMADFLEPGRKFLEDQRAALRARLPDEGDEVLREVAALRIGQRLRRRDRLFRDSVDFWNRLVAS